MPFKSKEEKLAWAKTLVVGDTVCDCRFRHMKIAQLDEEYHHTNFSAPIIRLIFKVYGLVPVKNKHSEWVDEHILDPIVFFLIDNIILDRVDPWLLKVGLTDRRTVDFTIVLEDGAQCSAMHCCDPADHEESIHAKS